MGRSLSGMGIRCGEACFAAFTTSNEEVAVCEIRRGFAGDHRASDGRSSSGIVAPAPGAHRCHLIIGGEFALVGFFYCQLDLSGQCFFVLDVIAKNVHRQVRCSLAVGFGHIGEGVGKVFR